MDFSAFQNYYFMRCFSKEQYRTEFNTGEKIYINSVQYFHDLEDEFQQDFEGIVFRQPKNTKAFLLKADANLTLDEAIEKAVNQGLQDGEWVMPTSDFKFYINGYIFCLTLIPKLYLKISDDRIVFNENYNISDGFYYLLNQYTQNLDCTYISLYDAKSFMEIFYPLMINKGYKISYGYIEYENISQEQKIKCYMEKNIHKLLFTKPERFSYQHEFRFFIQKNDKIQQDHIEESGIDIRSAVLSEFVYLSPEYAREKGLL